VGVGRPGDSGDGGRGLRGRVALAPVDQLVRLSLRGTLVLFLMACLLLVRVLLRLGMILTLLLLFLLFLCFRCFPLPWRPSGCHLSLLCFFLVASALIIFFLVSPALPLLFSAFLCRVSALFCLSLPCLCQFLLVFALSLLLFRHEPVRRRAPC